MSSKVKITDLSREIKKIRQQREVSDIADLKLNFHYDYSKFAQDVINKVSRAFITPLLQKKMDFNSLIKDVAEFVSDEGNIKVSINIEGLTEYEKELAISVIRYRNYTRKKMPDSKFIENSGLVKVRFFDSKDECTFLSSLKIPLQRKVRGQWGLKTRKGEHLFVCDLSIALAEVYIANQLNRYLSSRHELAMYTLLKRITKLQFFTSSSQVESINTLLKKYGMDVINPNSVKYVAKTKSMDEYDEWLRGIKEVDSVFLLRHVYLCNGPNIYLKYTSSMFGIKLYAYLKEMCRDNEEIVNDCQRLRNIQMDYATAYQTKKYIPRKIQYAMQHNRFLDYFGYVEYDADVDLIKMSQIEREFMELEKVLPIGYRRDYQLRFRKLGKHRALGLYFPSEKCVCIDLCGPSSTTHEILHMLDYSYSGKNSYMNKHSDLFSFKRISDAYMELVTNKINALGKNHPMYIEFYGHNKYNRDYYFCNTEMWARTGEIYVKKFKQINNSLIGDCNSVFYPDDDYFNSMLIEYFSWVLDVLEKCKPVKARKTEVITPIKVAAVMPTYRISDDGLQLTFL